MLDEAKAMIKVSKHDHIVNIQGISVNESCVYLLLEFCSNGAIEDYLQKNQKEFTKKLRDNTSREIICWSKQVADAMGFLAKKDIIHVSIVEFVASSVSLILNLNMLRQRISCNNFTFFFGSAGD